PRLNTGTVTNHVVTGTVGNPRRHRQTAVSIGSPECTGRRRDCAEGVGHLTAYGERHHPAVTPARCEAPAPVDTQRTFDLLGHRPQEVPVTAIRVGSAIRTRRTIRLHTDGGAVAQGIEIVIP